MALQPGMAKAADHIEPVIVAEHENDVAAAVGLSGCMGPTYGTGTSQGQQLFNDLDNIVTLGSTNRQRVDYSERKELVRPTAIGALPPPRAADPAVSEQQVAESPKKLVRISNGLY